MSHYVHCPYCGEDGRDVDTGICGCDEEKAAWAKEKAHAESVEAVVEAARLVHDSQGKCGMAALCAALAALDAARRG